MARSYSGLVDLVRRWSNRDTEVLPNNIIADCIRYAADKAYRRLRVPPLEHTVTYAEQDLINATSSSNNRFSSVTELAVPEDLIEFIQIREIDDAGRTTRIFNEKTDVRTFNDLYAEKYSDLAFWTRQGNCILLSPGFGNVGTNFGSSGVGNSTGLELYYYRRLPALHARYNVTAANGNLVTGEGRLLTDERPTVAEDTPEELTRDTVYYNADTDRYASGPGTGFASVERFGTSVPNWLRDENERIVLMGALAEVFFYLQENEEAQKYAQLFGQEIQELNEEDQMRNASGGNVQVNFNGRGLI